MPGITDLGSASSVAAGDQLAINQSGTDRCVTADKFAIVSEGTFTAAITCSVSGSITLETNWDSLAYCKLGKFVLVQGTLAVASVSSPVGAAMISNLPIAIAFSLTDGGEFFVGNARHSGAAPKLMNVFFAPGYDRPRIQYWTGSAWADAAAQIAAGDVIVISFSYLAAS